MATLHALTATLLRLTAFKSPLLRTVVPSVALAFTLQAAVAVPSIAARSERFYDLSGSVTYASCAALSLYLPVLRARFAGELAGKSALSLLAGAGMLNWRQVAGVVAVTVWAARLGSYLFARITAENGTDSRFESIRNSPPKFLVAFFAQASWVSLCSLPVFLLNAVPPAAFAALPAAVGLGDAAGLALAIGGFALEVAADRQKSAWVDAKREKRHSEPFLAKGLWARSRHPNYAGEITAWSGLATFAAATLLRAPALAGLGLAAYGVGGRALVAALCAASPAFVTFLLTRVSGIPLSEGKYDKRYGDRADYKHWKETTPVLLPKLWG